MILKNVHERLAFRLGRHAALRSTTETVDRLVTQIEQLQAEFGLQNEELIVRMTGCPNGCARPYMAEIAFVGKGPGKYQVYVGGNEASTRLNRVYRDAVKTEDLINELRPLLARYVQQRNAGERFGDFCARVIWPEMPAEADPNPKFEI